MSAIAPMTKLDAVNLMLADLGDRPVNTLTDLNRLDVNLAVQAIEATTRAILSHGWWFNTEEATLTPDGSGTYNLPADWAGVEYVSGGPTTGENGAPVLVARGRLLFDVANSTSTFVGGGEVTVTYFRLLEFEQLPMTAREYIYATASVRNQTRALGSASVDPDIRQQAVFALASLRNEEVEHSVDDLTYSPRFFQLMHNR